MVEFVPPSLNVEALLGIPIRRDVYSLLACKAGFFHSWILGCNFRERLNSVIGGDHPFFHLQIKKKMLGVR